MKMGIGIGWPNASAQNVTVSGWFYIIMSCGSFTPVNTFTIYQENTPYREGDFVFCTELDTRVMLGEISMVEPSGSQFNISGPIYNSCEI
jgi:hypothetical protein